MEPAPARRSLAFYGRLYGFTAARCASAWSELIELCELGPHRTTEYNELSTGLKQRLAFAKALLNRPEVLFLDEPTLGLDPDVSVRIRAQIASLRRDLGTTIILTTTTCAEAEELCDEIAFIKGGRILARGRRRAEAPDPHRRGGEPALDPAEPAGLAELSGVLGVRRRGEALEVTVDTVEKRLPELLRWLLSEGVEVRDMPRARGRSGGVFVELAR